MKWNETKGYSPCVSTEWQRLVSSARKSSEFRVQRVMRDLPASSAPTPTLSSPPGAQWEVCVCVYMCVVFSISLGLKF